ncbi:MAG TPA: AMP-binding protein [Polyangiales bacterium]|jgi:long-chain acyl-CoA synthetase|nr:AMP-binding protein [Polyangiales bacterium]
MSFIHEIVKAAKKRGNEALLIEVQGSRLVPMTGAEFLARVARVRAALEARGVQPGDRVGLLAPNSSDWAVMDVALLAHGAIVVPLYSRQDPRQLAAMLGDAAATLVLASDSQLAAALPGEFKVLTFDQALATSGAGPVPGVFDALPEAPATIIYTSGTSGEPKGVVLSRTNVDFMLAVTVARIREMTVHERAEDRVFHYLPFCFAGSRIMLWSQLWRGNPLYVSTDLNNLQEEMRTAKPHYFLNVPVLLERIQRGVESKLSNMGGPIRGLYQRAQAAYLKPDRSALSMREKMVLMLAQKLLFPRIRHMLGENLEFLVCGSARLSEDVQRWFTMIGMPVYQVYGLTETTGIVTIDDTKNVGLGRVGYAVPGCELKLSEEGELLCRGPNIFTGYWGRPDATAQVLVNGWLRTGDQAELDSRGSLRVIGRLKDVIVPASGHNVAPAPIEDLLQQAAEGIQQAVVVGHGRPYLTALVTGDVDPNLLDRALDRINAGLPHYQRVRKLYRAPEPFTPENGLLTANQKLRRAMIEARYRDAIEEMYR